MSLGDRLEETLSRFEDATEGVLGSSVISSSQALMMAGTSQRFDKNIIQGTSVKFLRLAMNTLNSLIENPTLKSVVVEEANYYLFIKPINNEYYLVVITDKSEIAGLRVTNLDTLITKLGKLI